MKKSYKPLALVVAGSLATAMGANAAISMAIGQPTASTRTDAYPYAGFGFYVPSTSTVQINQFGYWDEGGDGLMNPHTVTLFQYKAGTNKSYTQIASTVIPAGTSASLEGGYRWVTIPEFSITDNGQAGNYYVIMASHGGDAWTDGLGAGAPMNTAFGTLSTGSLDFGGGATLDEINGSATLFGGANFGYAVPEPSATLIAGLCGLSLTFVRGRTRR